MLLTFCLAVCPLSGTGEGILCMPHTLCLLVLGESGQLVSGCRVREASNSCSLWQWYWRCAYIVVVPFYLVGYPLWVALWALGCRSTRVPFPALLSSLIRSHFQAKPATLLIPIAFSFLFVVEELYGTRYQSGSFFLINVGSGFHCLRSFFLFLFTTNQNNQISDK